MTSWRQKAAIRLARRNFDDPHAINELADEALMLVSAALRLSAKNFVITRTMRDGLDYDEVALTAAVKADLRGIIGERKAEIGRLVTEQRRARLRRGWATRHDDYRRLDLPTLRRRENVARALAKRLTALTNDAEYLQSIVRTARDSALHEIIQARLIPLRQAGVDGRYEIEREERMDSLRAHLDLLTQPPADDEHSLARWV